MKLRYMINVSSLTLKTSKNILHGDANFNAWIPMNSWIPITIFSNQNQQLPAARHGLSFRPAMVGAGYIACEGDVIFPVFVAIFLWWFSWIFMVIYGRIDQLHYSDVVINFHYWWFSWVMGVPKKKNPSHGWPWLGIETTMVTLGSGKWWLAFGCSLWVVAGGSKESLTIAWDDLKRHQPWPVSQFSDGSGKMSSMDDNWGYPHDLGNQGDLKHVLRMKDTFSIPSRDVFHIFKMF